MNPYVIQELARLRVEQMTLVAAARGSGVRRPARRRARTGRLRAWWEAQLRRRWPDPARIETGRIEVAPCSR